MIIGAGEAGGRAAFALRHAGWSGEIQLLGSEPWSPYERPPLSKAALNGDGPRHAPAPIFEDAAFQENGITLRRSASVLDVDRTSRTVQLSTGESIAYEKVLLATGAEPRHLELAAGLPCTHFLRTHEDAVRLSRSLTSNKRVTIIGGGFIGLELAAAAISRGCSVTVLEMAPRILGRAVPEEVASLIHERHLAAGVRVECGVSIEAITETGTGAVIDLGDGTQVPCDVLVVGVGAIPRTEVAVTSGLRVENGIRVDEKLTTSDPYIFAAGDCASFPHQLFGGVRLRLESWRNAQDQAVIAAANMCGAAESYEAVPWFWSDQYELGLQVAGLPAAAELQIVRPRPDGVDIHYGLNAEGQVVSAAAVGPGNSVAKDIRLAEMMIRLRSAPSRDALADPSVNPKQLLN